ncbi:SDR family NAD(P)-dependent oxidoreductase [Streptomyces sp. NPDC007991]|uniref:SDR family NAD(P)-dependent oxidoreductase n=1 Tax=Streptomyces sp. NPDC007991 TaxID=3364803 RepID=UPI0036F17F15
MLVNNAGIIEWGTIEEQSLESFRRVIDVNLQGAWLGIHTAAPSLRRAGGGAIVNVSSIAGITGYAGIGGYVASKWALRGLTKAAALELAPDGIRVCSVHPGAVRTAMTAGFDDSFTAGQPLPRFGEPGEVARMVLAVHRRRRHLLDRRGVGDVTNGVLLCSQSGGTCSRSAGSSRHSRRRSVCPWDRGRDRSAPKEQRPRMSSTAAVRPR